MSGLEIDRKDLNLKVFRSLVKLWDLRKLDQTLQTPVRSFVNSSAARRYGIASIALDPTRQKLLVANVGSQYVFDISNLGITSTDAK